MRFNKAMVHQSIHPRLLSYFSAIIENNQRNWRCSIDLMCLFCWSSKSAFGWVATSLGIGCRVSQYTFFQPWYGNLSSRQRLHGEFQVTSIVISKKTIFCQVKFNANRKASHNFHFCIWNLTKTKHVLSIHRTIAGYI